MAVLAHWFPALVARERESIWEEPSPEYPRKAEKIMLLAAAIAYLFIEHVARFQSLAGIPKGQMSTIEPAYPTRVAVQTNCKQGGGPWAVDTPLMDTMVIGCNTHHDNARKGCSVGAVDTSGDQLKFTYIIDRKRINMVNSTSYNIIKDTSGLKPKHTQILTYKLTHLYYNWPGTVRV